ncbi:hypothetical protein [Chryseobacterium sp. RR2-3-20]|uniref:hypothetical protein n=1 Tax=Chryseobacterium sp. RR2-3-20 TaxID=2787626 RepID=UPI001ADFBC33|nr:hypothetical protein [Chryseobacterium sp. RR2-3-20]
MKKVNKIILIVSLLVLLNIVFQAFFYRQRSEVEIEWLQQIVSFLANFNFLTVLFLPILLLIYSVITVVKKEKYGMILLTINVVSFILLFFT